jgi:hypothetical protein
MGFTICTPRNMRYYLNYQMKENEMVRRRILDCSEKLTVSYLIHSWYIPIVPAEFYFYIFKKHIIFIIKDIFPPLVTRTFCWPNYPSTYLPTHPPNHPIYRRADYEYFPPVSTVSAREWIYATNLSRPQRETRERRREREKKANGTWEKHTVY